MAKYSINFSHHIQFQGTSILSIKCGHMEHSIGEVTETEIHPKNIDRKEGFSLSKSWKPLLQTLKE